MHMPPLLLEIGGLLHGVCQALVVGVLLFEPSRTFLVPIFLKQKTNNGVYYFSGLCPVICACGLRLVTPDFCLGFRL
jgi:hypothetical protein